ncbi:MAG: aminopeptidase [Deltaproteobacteria bacterium HGW-Deltaproteobacteria-4]|nr:MAG: aminopeptidase [Deltaproteobacteria bacterium HGW-Deltaproteobacteria-4]
MKRAMLLFSSLCGLVFCTPGLALCSDLGYYAQAIQGHVKILLARRPIEQLLVESKITPALKERLQLVLEIRDFASHELDLPENDSYRSYADIQRAAVVTNVIAAKEFSLQPLIWCFPFAGCVSYRGYYDPRKAESFAAGLRDQGYETDLYGVSAYSTLGWFDDPVLNTFIDWPEAALAGQIFHELAHQQLYVKDDSSFNEAFAEVVEAEGVKRWLARQGQAPAADAMEEQERRQAFVALLLQTRHDLEVLYASGKSLQVMRAEKKAVFSLLRQRYQLLRDETWQGYSGFDRWFERPVNNARLAAVATYHDRKPSFLALLQRTDGDLSRFYEEAAALAKRTRAERDEILAELAKAQ